MKKIYALSIFAVLLSATLYSADTPNAKLSDCQKREAVTLLRSVATAEFRYRSQSGGKFGTVSDLIRAGLLKTDNADEPLPGFKLRVVIPADGARYQVSLIHSTKWGLFTDEDTLIYIGQAQAIFVSHVQ